MFHMGITKITQAKGSFIEFLNCGLKGDPCMPVCLSPSSVPSVNLGSCSEELRMWLRDLIFGRMFHKKSSFSRRFLKLSSGLVFQPSCYPLFIYASIHLRSQASIMQLQLLLCPQSAILCPCLYLERCYTLRVISMYFA